MTMLVEVFLLADYLGSFDLAQLVLAKLCKTGTQ